MAELEEVLGKVSGSDGISDYPCSSCDKNNIQVEASWRCVDCRANLCGQCLAQHDKFVLTGSHTVLSKQEALASQGQVGATVIRQTCRTHTDQVVAMYCGNHDRLCCGTCSASHRACQQLKPIPEAARDIEPQKDLEKVTRKVNLVTDQLKHLKQSRQERLEQLGQDKSRIHEGFSNFRAMVEEKLNQLEEKAKAEVEDTFIQLSTHIENDIARLSNLIGGLEETIRCIGDLTRDNAVEAFVCMKDAEGQIADSKAVTNEVDALEGTETLQFVFSTEVEDYLRNLETIGSVTDFFSLSVTLLDRPNVKAKSDASCDIYDCCLMEDGRVVLTDVGNKTLKLLDRSYALVDQLRVSCRPCGVCQVARDQVAVAMLDEEMIQFADISDKITTTGCGVIKVGKPCRGITSCGDRLFVTCGGGGPAGGPGQVRIYSRSGQQLLHTIQQDRDDKDLFPMPLHIDVSLDGNQIAVANRMEGVVVLDSNGVHKWSFNHPDLKHVVGVCHVDAATVLVSGYKSSNVFQLGPNGKMHSELLSNPVGMPSFYSLSYDHVNKRLIVSGRSSELAVYQAYRGQHITFPSGSAV